MKTTIGINILAKTAKAQDQIIEIRESRTYYQEPYHSSLRIGAKSIIEKYTDCNWEIKSDTKHMENGDVMNAIIFVFYNKKGIKKRELRAELENYINGYVYEI